MARLGFRNASPARLALAAESSPDNGSTAFLETADVAEFKADFPDVCVMCCKAHCRKCALLMTRIELSQKGQRKVKVLARREPTVVEVREKSPLRGNKLVTC